MGKSVSDDADDIGVFTQCHNRRTFDCWLCDWMISKSSLLKDGMDKEIIRANFISNAEDFYKHQDHHINMTIDNEEWA